MVGIADNINPGAWEEENRRLGVQEHSEFQEIETVGKGNSISVLVQVFTPSARKVETRCQGMERQEISPLNLLICRDSISSIQCEDSSR